MSFPARVVKQMPLYLNIIGLFDLFTTPKNYRIFIPVPCGQKTGEQYETTGAPVFTAEHAEFAEITIFCG